MEMLLDQIPLDKVSISMTINAPASVLLAMVIAVARKQGVAENALRGTVQNDILKEYIARGTYIFPPAPSMRLITDLFRCARPTCPTGTRSASPAITSGRPAARRAGDRLHAGERHRVRQGGHRAGQQVDDFGPQLAFFFNAHNNFIEEVAKFRAAAHLGEDHARAVRRAGPEELAAALPHPDRGLHADRAAAGEQRRARVTLQALAAVLGGTQSLHTNSRDEALALPSQGAVEVALRTQQVIAYESGVADTVDPLAAPTTSSR